MNINTDKLEFLPKFRQAGVIMVQSDIGTAKMYPSNKDNILEGVKRGRNLKKLQNFFTPESIANAKAKEEKKPVDSNKGDNKPKK